MHAALPVTRSLCLPRPASDAAATLCEPRTLSDEQIVARVLDGDLASFELIMRRYNQRIFRLARSIVRDEDEAEDIVQETYVRAFQHLAQYSGQARFSTWLTKVALHEALARRRRAKRLRLVDLSDPLNSSMVPTMSTPGAEQQSSVKELHAFVTAAVDELPEELRMVFVMRLVEGLDTAQTAECLDLTESNVKVRLHRARLLLRDRLEARIGDSFRQLYEFGGNRCNRIVHTVMARISRQ